MSNTNVIVDVAFLQYGLHAPSNSSFTGTLNSESLFGGFFDYTARDGAVNGKTERLADEGKTVLSDKDNSESSGSFMEYTSRDYAVAGSGNSKYFTMSSEGKLFTEEDRQNFRKKWSTSFSNKGDLAWTIVVSLDNYGLLDVYGIKGQMDFAQVTTAALNKAFQQIHFDPSNMIWWEDYHTNTAHPHIHVTFLEKQNTRSRGKLTAKEIKLLKTTFITEIAARRTYFEKYNLNSDNALKNLQTMKTEIVTRAKSIPFQTIDEIMNLYTQLPESGRLQYNSTHMIPFRNKLDEIVDLLLKHESIKEAYTDFVGEIEKLATNVNSLGKEDISYLKESQEKKLRTQIANAVLQEYKSFSNDAKIMRVREWKQRKGEGLIRLLSGEYCTSELSSSEQNSPGISTSDNDSFEDVPLVLPISPLSEEDDPFIDGSVLIISPHKATDPDDGLVLIYQAAEQGDPRAKKYMNFIRKSYGMNKKTYHTAQEQLSNRLIPIIVRGINEKKNAVDDEISAYLYGDGNHISTAIGSR